MNKKKAFSSNDLFTSHVSYKLRRTKCSAESVECVYSNKWACFSIVPLNCSNKESHHDKRKCMAIGREYTSFASPQSFMVELLWCK